MRNDPSVRNEAWGALNGVHVLLIDDHADSLEALSLYLRFCGAAVTTAQNGAEALGCLAATSATVLVVDYAMPGMTGVELLSAVRNLPGQAQHPTPAILCTAYGEVRDASLAAGFSAYLRKPLDPSVLAGEIARLAH